MLDLEYDGMDRDDFHNEQPHIHYREAFFVYQYGATREEIRNMDVCMDEWEGTRVREYDFTLENIPMTEAQEYLKALEIWVCTGELNVGPYQGCPDYKPWRYK